ncbi:MAG: hypothetical protein AAGA30_07295 [Planctomycetota bacterium]
MNALSYFFRSGGVRSLVQPRSTPQAIGFPFEVWRYGVSYGGAQIDFQSFVYNLILILSLGVVFGLVFTRYRIWLNHFVDYMIELEESKLGDGSTFQFSISGMFWMTGAAAVVALLLRWAGFASPSLLLGVYLFGPSALIVLAMIPRKISWQARVVLLAPATLLLIGYAMVVGSKLQLPFDHVMMGIFICWVPQTVIAAGCLTMGLAIRYNSKAM